MDHIAEDTAADIAEGTAVDNIAEDISADTVHSKVSDTAGKDHNSADMVMDSSWVQVGKFQHMAQRKGVANILAGIQPHNLHKGRMEMYTQMVMVLAAVDHLARKDHMARKDYMVHKDYKVRNPCSP